MFGQLGNAIGMYQSDYERMHIEIARQQHYAQQQAMGLQNALAAQQQMCTRYIPEEPKESPLLVLLTGE